jgi:hypothetical protein
MANAYLQGCCLAVLVRFRLSNLGLDNVLLGRQTLLQEAASSTLKNKKGGKKVRGRKRETKKDFEGETKCYGLDQYC